MGAALPEDMCQLIGWACPNSSTQQGAHFTVDATQYSIYLNSKEFKIRAEHSINLLVEVLDDK
jgi:hypothetical protein